MGEEENRRKDDRIKHSALVRVLKTPASEHKLTMRDFSESGIYLYSDNTEFFHIGEKVEVQTLEFEGAPIIEAEVVRVEENQGFAVKFL